MTQSMLELKVPAPIRTFGATITIEGELPAFTTSGTMYPTWAHSGESYWGGDNEVLAGAWDSGRTYSFGNVVAYDGYIYQAPSPVPSVGTAPLPGHLSGGTGDTFDLYGASAYTSTGGQQGFRTSREVTVSGVSILGYGPPGGMQNGYRVKLSRGNLVGSGGAYDNYDAYAEGTFQGPDGSDGWCHIAFDRPARLNTGTTYYIVHDGNDSVHPSFVAGVSSHFGFLTLTSPVDSLTDDWRTGVSGYGSALAGPNADHRLGFNLWESSWRYLPDAIQAVTRDARFLVYVGASGQSFDDITEDMMDEVSTVDTTYVGPSAFGGTGPPGTTRRCFRIKDIVPANSAAQQSVYLKYVPTLLPEDAPHGVAVYNVTAEPYTPGYELGPHSTTALFRPI